MVTPTSTNLYAYGLDVTLLAPSESLLVAELVTRTAVGLDPSLQAVWRCSSPLALRSLVGVVSAVCLGRSPGADSGAASEGTAGPTLRTQHRDGGGVARLSQVALGVQLALPSCGRRAFPPVGDESVQCLLPRRSLVRVRSGVLQDRCRDRLGEGCQ